MLSIKSKHYENNTETHIKLSFWVSTSYTSPTMLSVRPQLLLSSNSKISTLGAMVQNVKFLSVGENKDLSLNLNSTHQHDSRGMLGFQNKASDKDIEISCKPRQKC